VSTHAQQAPTLSLEARRSSSAGGAPISALEAGVFVRNCGIIVNVTPLEPTWEGYLTFVISNTTPLPAKI
jgi:hypothetical protein